MALLTVSCARPALSADPALASIPGRAEAAVVLIRTNNMLRSSRGSGFVVGDGSWVVTASHVVSVDLGKGKRVSDQTALVYSPWTGRPIEARVVAIDGVADIALLRLPQAGHPALPVEGLDVKDAEAARTALQGRKLALYGFPLTFGRDTVASLAKPEHNDSRLREITQRGETNLCALDPCPDAQPGWSGGPILSLDKGTVVAIFHSMYRKAGAETGVPAGSLAGYLGDLLRRAGAADLGPFGQPPEATVPKPARGRELMAHEMRSLSWSAAGNWIQAEQEQRDILKAAPNDPMALVELGKLQLEQQRFEEGLNYLKSAAAAAPKSVLARQFLGRAFHLNFDSDSAARSLKEALELSPTEVEPQLALAGVHEDNQRPDQAEAVLRSAMERIPDHPGIVYRLGMLLIQHKKDDEGHRMLLKAAEMSLFDPGLAFIVGGRGRALENARKPREAEAAYRQALRVDPEYAEGHYMLASFLLRQNRIEEAQIELNQGIRSETLSETLVQAFRMLQARINERAAATTGKK